jgi:transcriptional regulator with XRE-family HTH domain
MDETAADLLRRLRIERGLSQPKLGALAGVDPATISRIELKKSPGELSVWQKIAGALDVTVSTFTDRLIQRDVVPDNLYPSLVEFLAKMGRDVSASERRELIGYAGKDRDPGPAFWPVYLQAVRIAANPGEDVANDDPSGGGVLPLKRRKR